VEKGQGEAVCERRLCVAGIVMTCDDENEEGEAGQGEAIAHQRLNRFFLPQRRSSGAARREETQRDPPCNRLPAASSSRVFW
jgi:hypothetical protein